MQKWHSGLLPLCIRSALLVCTRRAPVSSAVPGGQVLARYPTKYYVAIPWLNVLLRLTWALNILPGSTLATSAVGQEVVILLVALLEVRCRYRGLSVVFYGTYVESVVFLGR